MSWSELDESPFIVFSMKCTRVKTHSGVVNAGKFILIVE